jgi:FlaG/FlaF family flagellin (archaellin)
MKSLRRMFRAKRAFSAVIASLILMLLAVAAGVVVYSYVMGWIGGATQNPTHTGQMQFDSLSATAATNGSIQVYVRNIGGINLTVSSIYVGGANKTFTGSSLDIPVLSVAGFTVSYNATMTKNTFYEVAVVCNDGTTVSQSVQAK